MVNILLAKSCWCIKSIIMLGKVAEKRRNRVGEHRQNHDGEHYHGKNHVGELKVKSCWGKFR